MESRQLGWSGGGWGEDPRDRVRLQSRVGGGTQTAPCSCIGTGAQRGDFIPQTPPPLLRVAPSSFSFHPPQPGRPLSSGHSPNLRVFAGRVGDAARLSGQREGRVGSNPI